MNEDTKPVGKTNQCPQCGLALPSGALEGLCPACLLRQGAADSATRPAQHPFEPPSLDEVKKLFPALEILSFLGKGGMGAVYKARQSALDRFVAIKLLPSREVDDASFKDRFAREAQALARLSHPSIVTVHEFGEVQNHRYLIMEYVDGVNLRQLEKTKRLSPREALQIIPQICDALQYAHDQGVVHRDIKPENLMIDRKGRVVITDFGLAKMLDLTPQDLRLTAEGQVMGTPHYMAPEQVEQPWSVDHRADIYSLGVVLYELLTGELPLGNFQAPSKKIQVDIRMDDVVLRALEKEPDRRYQHASQVGRDLETISSAAQPGEPLIASNKQSIREPAGPKCEERLTWLSMRKPTLYRAAALLAIGVLILAFLNYQYGSHAHNLSLGEQEFKRLTPHQHQFNPPSTHPYRAQWKSFSAIVQSLTLPDLKTDICWSPDGVLLCGLEEDYAAANILSRKTKKIGIILSFPKASTNMANDLINVHCGGVYVQQTTWMRDGQHLLVVVDVPSDSNAIDVSVGFPGDNWTDTDAAWDDQRDWPSRTERTLRRYGQQMSVTPISRGETSVTYRTTYMRRSYLNRMVALDGSGSLHEPLTMDNQLVTSQNNLNVMTCMENFSKLENILEFRMQVRPASYFHFRNISLVPGKKLNPTVSLDSGFASQGWPTNTDVTR